MNMFNKYLKKSVTALTIFLMIAGCGKTDGYTERGNANVSFARFVVLGDSDSPGEDFYYFPLTDPAQHGNWPGVETASYAKSFPATVAKAMGLKIRTDNPNDKPGIFVVPDVQSPWTGETGDKLQTLQENIPNIELGLVLNNADYPKPYNHLGIKHGMSTMAVGDSELHSWQQSFFRVGNTLGIPELPIDQAAMLNPTFVLIAYHVNDAFRGETAQQVAAALEKMISKLKAANPDVRILVSNTGYFDESALIPIQAYRDAGVTGDLYGNLGRPLNNDDHVLLEVPELILSGFLGSEEMPIHTVFDAGRVAYFHGHVAAQNTAVEAVISATANVELWDRRALHNTLASKEGLTIDGIKLTTRDLTAPGYLMSHTGLYFDVPLGHAVLAYDIIETINTTWGTSLPLPDIAEIYQEAIDE